MAHEFKKLSDVEIAEAISESANVLIEEEGNIKRVSKNAIGGGGAGIFLCHYDGTTISENHADAVAAYQAGAMVIAESTGGTRFFANNCKWDYELEGYLISFTLLSDRASTTLHWSSNGVVSKSDYTFTAG